MSWDGDGLLIVGDQAETYGGQERVFETLLQHYPAADAVIFPMFPWKSTVRVSTHIKLLMDWD